MQAQNSILYVQTEMATKGEAMRSTAYSFCSSFAAGMSGPDCLDKYFTATPLILEHGPSWATTRLPFLATTFEGRRSDPESSGMTCDDYYDLLSHTLSFDPSSVAVPDKESLAVDEKAGMVTVKLHARFSSVKTGRSWEEDFVYVLSNFNEDGRIGRQELWADPLSAWMACQS